MDDKIIAVIKKPYQKPETVAIDNGLEALQKIVGGNIDVVYLPNIDDIHGYCNDEGIFCGMEPNFYRPDYGDAILGPAVFMSSGAGGESESLSPEQVKRITEYLEANSVKDFGEFLFHINTGFEHYKPQSASCM